VIDLMALDVNNPRSILYQVSVMRSIAENLPAANKFGRVSPVLSVLLPLEADLLVASPLEISVERLAALRQSMAELSNRLSAMYLV
jgi:uncharacterized alpha-E superfamily protein